MRSLADARGSVSSAKGLGRPFKALARCALVVSPRVARRSGWRGCARRPRCRHPVAAKPAVGRNSDSVLRRMDRRHDARLPSPAYPGRHLFLDGDPARTLPNDLLVRHIDALRDVVRRTLERHLFHIDAWVVLPDHLHAVWTLPEGDADFANRWRTIKQHFSRTLDATEGRSVVRLRRGERGIWQRRFWEHAIRNERDFAAHVDYVHINPVKHGYVVRVQDWPFSTFRRFVEAGICPMDWGSDPGLTTISGEGR
jgi:putative transposase